MKNLVSSQFYCYDWGVDEIILQVLLDKGPLSRKDLIEEVIRMLCFIKIAKLVVPIHD